MFSVNNPKYPIYSPQISFGQNTDIPKEVLIYLRKRKRSLSKKDSFSRVNINNYNTAKLEGIQNGIDIFKGLSLKQIFFLISHTTEVMLKRGCHNMCAHCYAKAMPESHIEVPNQINKIEFEDFENLCNGIKELNNRFGFKVFDKSAEKYNTLFHDADSSMITLTDKTGKIYDYADLSKMLHDATGRVVLFDTAGWNIQDVKTQKRMEALVKKIMATDNYNFMEFCVSINPFHSIYNMALNLEKSGNITEARKLTDIYTDRMANVLYTLAPLRRKTNSITNSSVLKFNMRALSDDVSTNKYTEMDLQTITNVIREKLKTIYQTNITLNQRNNVQIEDIEWISKNLDKAFDIDNISAVGRASEIITNKKSEVYKNTIASLYNDTKKGAKNCEDGMIDLNGNFYVTNWYETYPTDISLNYVNKGKPTASINPNLRKEIITKNLM